MQLNYFSGENKNIEYKRELPAKHEKFLKDIIAFSNCSGGKMIIGIEDKTNVVCGIGDVNPFKLSDDISNMIADACTPLISTDISVQTLEDKTILVVDVPPGKSRPYYLKSVGKENSTYVRINATSRPADARKIQELELEGNNISYDTLQDIGKEYSEERALELCNAMYNVAIGACKSEEEKSLVHKMTISKLEDMGLLCKTGNDYAPTHAFTLMTENKLRHSKIQCALFKGLHRDVFIDRKEFRGPVYTQIEDAFGFVIKHINMGTEIEGIIRQDGYELPVGAIREMIVNAVTHRSYLDDSCIQVSIFDDRIEVLSPGMLYGGLDMESAKSGKSKCRNSAIAEAFFYMGIIEAWGTGLPRIIERCREYGLKEPVFEEFGDSFRSIIYRNAPNMGSDGQKVGNARQKVSIKSVDKEVSIKDVDKKINRRKTQEQYQIIMNHMVIGEEYSSLQIAELLNVGVNRAKAVLREMTAQNMIESIGSNRNRRYRKK